MLKYTKDQKITCVNICIIFSKRGLAACIRKMKTFERHDSNWLLTCHPNITTSRLADTYTSNVFRYWKRCSISLREEKRQDKPYSAPTLELEVPPGSLHRMGRPSTTPRSGWAGLRSELQEPDAGTVCKAQSVREEEATSRRRSKHPAPVAAY